MNYTNSFYRNHFHYAILDREMRQGHKEAVARGDYQTANKMVKMALNHRLWSAALCLPFFLPLTFFLLWLLPSFPIVWGFPAVASFLCIAEVIGALSQLRRFNR